MIAKLVLIAVGLFVLWGCRPGLHEQDGLMVEPPREAAEHPTRSALDDEPDAEPSAEPGLGWWVIQRVASSQAEQDVWFLVPAGQVLPSKPILRLPACPSVQGPRGTPPPDAPPNWGQSSPPVMLQGTWVAPGQFVILCVSSAQHGWCPPDAPCAWLWDVQEDRWRSAPFYTRSLFSQAWPGPEASLTFPCLWQETWGVCESRFDSQDVRFLHPLADGAELAARHPRQPLLALHVFDERGCERASSSRPGAHLRFIDLDTGRTWTWPGFDALFGPPRCLPRQAGASMAGWFRWAFLGWNPRAAEEFALMVWQYPDDAPADQPLAQVPFRGWLVVSDARGTELVAEPLPEGVECILWAPDGQSFLCQDGQHPGVYVWVDRGGQVRQRWRFSADVRIRQWLPAEARVP